MKVLLLLLLLGRSVMSDSVRSHRWQPTRLPRPWDSPGKNTGVGCPFLLQCLKVKSESEVAQLCPTTSWTAAYQAPPYMGFSRQEYWSGVPLPSPFFIIVVAKYQTLPVTWGQLDKLLYIHMRSIVTNMDKDFEKKKNCDDIGDAY